MKTHVSLSAAGGLLSLALSLAAGPLAGRAAPLTATAAVQTQPDPSSPVVTYLKAGSEPAPAQGNAIAAPGWMAVDLPGPFEAYVQEKDFTKGLDVKPGSSLYLAPKADAGVLTVAEKGDKIVITGLDGRWTQVRLDQHLTGYINTTPSAAAPAPVDLASAPAAASAPIAPAVGKPAPAGEAAASPRVLEGKFVSTHHFLSGHVPYDWAIVDEAGSRLAYLDLSKLLLTEQPATYAGKSVVVSGSLQPGPDGQDVVLTVESLQLQ